jgi:hypothetical protein
VILVSNNIYRFGVVGSGSRPRLDGGELGIAVWAPSHDGGGSSQQWSAPDVEITSTQPVPVGVDGEALVLDPPLRFVSRPAALRVRIAPQHPGASPTASLPTGFFDFVRQLFAVAVGRA